MPDPVFDEFTRAMTNTQIAEDIIYIAPHLDSELAKAIMIEAARRLRDDDETQYVEPPPPNNPPLKAEAIPE